MKTPIITIKIQNEEIEVIKFLENIKLSDDDNIKFTTSNKKNEDKLIISENIKIKDYNINIASKELNHGIESFNNHSFSRNKNNFLVDCFKGIYNCNSDFEGLDLHKSPPG